MFLTGLFLTLVLTAASAVPASEPLASPVPRVDRNLLLGFLADNETMTLIDARSPEEFAAQHLPGAINVPVDAVESEAGLLPDDKSQPVVVYCRTGRRAGLLRDELRAKGYTDVRILPREQIYWHDGFMAFNCSTGTPQTSAETAAPRSLISR